MLERYYVGAGPLLLLGIDTDLLTSPWRDDEIAPGVSYPHIYGPLNLDAVVAITPLAPRATARTFFPRRGGPMPALRAGLPRDLG